MHESDAMSLRAAAATAEYPATLNSRDNEDYFSIPPYARDVR